MSGADSPDPRIKWLDARYPLPDGWLWCRVFDKPGPLFDAVILSERWISIRVGVRDGCVNITRAHQPGTSFGHPPTGVVEQVLAVARLDPEEIGRESEPLAVDPRCIPFCARLSMGSEGCGGPPCLLVRGLPPTREALARALDEMRRMPLVVEPRSDAADLEALRQEVERLAFKAAKLADIKDQAGEDAIALLGRALHEIGLELQVLEDIAHGSGARQIEVEP